MSMRLMLKLGLLCSAMSLVACTASGGTSDTSTSAQSTKSTVVTPGTQAGGSTLSPQTTCDPPHCFGDCTVVQTPWPTSDCEYIMTHCDYGCTNGVCNTQYDPKSPPIGNGC